MLLFDALEATASLVLLSVALIVLTYGVVYVAFTHRLRNTATAPQGHRNILKSIKYIPILLAPVRAKKIDGMGNFFVHKYKYEDPDGNNHFDELPVELVTRILNYVGRKIGPGPDSKKLKELSTVCKMWRTSCHDITFQFDLKLRHCASVNDETIVKLLNQYPSVSSLQLGWCPDLTDDGMASIAKMAPNLRKFELCDARRVTNTGVLALLSECNLIESLVLKGCAVDVSGLLPLKNNKHLKSVMVINSAVRITNIAELLIKLNQ